MTWAEAWILGPRNGLILLRFSRLAHVAHGLRWQAETHTDRGRDHHADQTSREPGSLFHPFRRCALFLRLLGSHYVTGGQEKSAVYHADVHDDVSHDDRPGY